ncbi:MAG: cyclic lactone autoinducer peptide [Bacilli bacterium]|jgi:cyclic lactone autoinducer peptide|nr:cyclic lactone autoinducer peptide [Bacilli bacterium]
MKLLSTIVAAIGAFIAATATSGCYIIYLDEPEMPESLM